MVKLCGDYETSIMIKKTVKSIQYFNNGNNGNNKNHNNIIITIYGLLVELSTEAKKQSNYHWLHHNKSFIERFKREVVKSQYATYIKVIEYIEYVCHSNFFPFN